MYVGGSKMVSDNQSSSYEFADPRGRAVRSVACLILASFGSLVLYAGLSLEQFSGIGPIDFSLSSHCSILTNLIVVFVGLALLYGSALECWKAIDLRPTVVATKEGMVFHPAVNLKPITFDQVESWTAYPKPRLYSLAGQWEIRMRLKQFRWSPGSVIPTRTMNFVGQGDMVDGLCQFLIENTDMWRAFVLPKQLAP